MSLLFTYKSTIILSETANTADVGSALILISTGFVLLVSQPIRVVSDVNNVVFVPPEVYFETT